MVDIADRIPGLKDGQGLGYSPVRDAQSVCLDLSSQDGVYRRAGLGTVAAILPQLPQDLDFRQLVFTTARVKQHSQRTRHLGCVSFRVRG